MFSLFPSPIKKGLKLIKERRYAEAEMFFTKLVSKKPKLAEAYLYLGRSLFANEKYAEAKVNLHKALELKPSTAIIQELVQITNWEMICPYKYFNGYPCFSMDGQQLAYISVRKENEDYAVSYLENGGLYIYNLKTKTERCIVPDTYTNSFPSFAPNGKKIAYLSLRPQESISVNDNNPALYLLDLETGRETKLTEETCKVKHPRFHPDGKRIVFACWRKGDQNSGIYSIDILTKKMECIIPGVYETTFPSVCNSGRKLAFSAWRRDTNGDGSIDIRDNSGIYIKDLVAGIETIAAKDTYNNSFPSFSNDGDMIVYLSVRKDTNNDRKIDTFDNPGIYVYDLKKKKEICVVDDKYFNKFASFVPDGTKVAFISNKRSPTEHHLTRGYFEFKGVYVADIKKKKIKQLLSEDFYGCRSLVVSPLGNKAAYVSWHHDSSRGLYLADLDRLPSPEEAKKYIENLTV